ncbi:hypothetical protein ACFL2Q_19095 [Thermodesulfobacteriota bacterium]
MIRKTIILMGVLLVLIGYVTNSSLAGPPMGACPIDRQSPQCATDQSDDQPRCKIEITCTDKPIQLGYSGGVCFRASCPGVWAVLHRRTDQASFRKRIWTYRHYTFKGYWQLKDQGAIQSGPVLLRELFLVGPDDLIEFRLRDCDKYARVELQNLGYVKRGDFCELKKWLAKQSYRNGPALIASARDRLKREAEDRVRKPCNVRGAPWPIQFGEELLFGLASACRSIGLPF